MNSPIEVLLATYNGERFLREQVESVLAQQDVDVRVLAHDDGSRDGTRNILRDYAARFPERIRVLEDGVRCGSAKDNFKHILHAATAQYIAFCDQDDVWLPQKLSLELERMHVLEAEHGEHTPLLVYSDLRVVDESLTTIKDSLWQANGLRNAQHPTFAQLLTENVVTGCTALLNRPLALLMQSMPATAQMHDHWAALLACGLGAMQAVPQATVLYRQHAQNVVGAVQSHPALIAKLMRFVSSEGADARSRQLALDQAQATSLLQFHGDNLPSAHRQTLAAFLNLQQQPLLQRFRTTSQYGLWRADGQRRIAQAIDLLRARR